MRPFTVAGLAAVTAVAQASGRAALWLEQGGEPGETVGELLRRAADPAAMLRLLLDAGVEPDGRADGQ